MPNRVVHFEIQADDVERVKKFYENIFGWKIEKFGGPMEYWMVMTAEQDSKEVGISGGLQKRSTKAPEAGMGTNAFTCVVDVKNFDETAEKILASGGKIALPKYAIPGMAWIGYFLDTEGNTFGLFQADATAK